jgi:hypothetical protein
MVGQGFFGRYPKFEHPDPAVSRLKQLALAYQPRATPWVFAFFKRLQAEGLPHQVAARLLRLSV